MDLGTGGINPIWAVITAVIGGAVTYFTKKNSNESSVEIAKINSKHAEDAHEEEVLRRELEDMRDSYLTIKTKYEECQSRSLVESKTMLDYRNLIRHYKFIFKLIYKQIVPQLEADSSSYVLMEEVKEMFRDDFTL